MGQEIILVHGRINIPMSVGRPNDGFVRCNINGQVVLHAIDEGDSNLIVEIQNTPSAQFM